MSNFLQEHRLKQKLDQSGNQGFAGTLLAVATGSDPYTDTVGVAYGRGKSSKLTNHPFMGPNSWIRCMPEKGSQFLMSMRGDVKEMEIARSYNQSPSTRLRNYAESNNTYRPLSQGEIDIQSSGYAGSFLSERGNYEFRAGGLTGAMSRDELEIYWKSPVHSLRGPMHKAGEIGDEQRFGVVSRPSKDRPKTVSTFLRVGGQSWGKEYMRVLKSKNSPSTLVDYREGNVVDDDGSVPGHTISGKALRARAKFGNVDGSTTKWELDEAGNIAVYLPASADEGFVLSVPTGPITLKSGKDLKLFVADHMVMSSGKNFAMSIGDNLELGSAKETVLRGGTAFGIKSGSLAAGQYVSSMDFTSTGVSLTTLGKVESTSTLTTVLNAASIFARTTSGGVVGLEADRIMFGRVGGTMFPVARQTDSIQINAATDPTVNLWFTRITAAVNTMYNAMFGSNVVTPIPFRLTGKIITGSSVTMTA